MNNCNSNIPSKKSRKPYNSMSLRHIDSSVTDNTLYKSSAIFNNPDAEMQDIVEDSNLLK